MYYIVVGGFQFPKILKNRELAVCRFVIDLQV